MKHAYIVYMAMKKIKFKTNNRNGKYLYSNMYTCSGECRILEKVVMATRADRNITLTSKNISASIKWRK